MGKRLLVLGVLLLGLGLAALGGSGLGAAPVRAMDDPPPPTVIGNWCTPEYCNGDPATPTPTPER